jgi:penicillin-binding protein 1A
MLSFILKNIAATFYKVEANRMLNEVLAILKISPSSDTLNPLIDALIAAEDHRFKMHKGIDYRAILRAIFVIVLTTRMEGGSTITQQLTRVITGDFRKSINRKFKELCLAAWLDSKISKYEQAIAYLRVGYFGWKMNGYEQAARRLGIDLPCTTRSAAVIIARLKYPEPRNPSESHSRRISRRAEHIIEIMEGKK